MKVTTKGMCFAASKRLLSLDMYQIRKKYPYLTIIINARSANNFLPSSIEIIDFPSVLVAFANLCNGAMRFCDRVHSRSQFPDHLAGRATSEIKFSATLVSERRLHGIAITKLIHSWQLVIGIHRGDTPREHRWSRGSLFWRSNHTAGSRSFPITRVTATTFSRTFHPFRGSLYFVTWQVALAVNLHTNLHACK